MMGRDTPQARKLSLILDGLVLAIILLLIVGLGLSAFSFHNYRLAVAEYRQVLCKAPAMTNEEYCRDMVNKEAE